MLCGSQTELLFTKLANTLFKSKAQELSQTYKNKLKINIFFQKNLHFCQEYILIAN